MNAISKTLRTLGLAAILALAGALPAQASNFTDLWWNPAESGWGMTLTHHHDKIFGVWYVYDTDGKPFWVVMPDGVFSNNGRTFSGTVYRTNGPSYRAATFNPAAVLVNVTGTARIDFDADDVNASVNLTIGTQQIAKRVQRQAFGNAPVNFPADRSDIWYNPTESGWGITLSHHGDKVFAVWYTYAEDNRPLWVVLPAGEWTSATSFSGKLYTTTGSPYTALFDPNSTSVTEVGSATVTFGTDNATFRSTVNGHTQTKTIVRQGFGTPTGNGPPRIESFSLVAGASPLLAPGKITLKATAMDRDGAIAKVIFFNGCEKVGEKSAAPYEWVMTNLPAGFHNFSARAIDNLGESSPIASAKMEVKASGGGSPPTGGNKAPTVAFAGPANNTQILQGASLDLIATANDADGQVLKVEYFASTGLTAPARIGEALALPWLAIWENVPAGTYSLTAVATDDKGASTTSVAVTVNVAAPAVAFDAATRDAARFLTQATFGIKAIAEIDALKARGYAAWLDEQFALQPESHLGYIATRLRAGEKADEERAYEAIWQQWLWEPGQLRARMSFALSEIVVISNIAPDMDTYALSSYMDMLNRNAFGNYRTLLGEVALHPAMGYYLNMMGSKKVDLVKGTHPNENFAREVMQLFSIGLYKLNPDGTRMLDGAGKPINTYDENAIKGMAAAFTGWNFAGNDTANAAIFNPAKANWVDPMLPWEMWHDTAAKTIIDGIVLPAGQSARKDLNDALDALFNHPNVGPFIGRQLIQRFVTSNPSPAYIGRVAAAFANNGSGVRGDLRATLRAVLMDPEARDLAITAQPGWGKQREPAIRFANVLRGLNATSTSGRNRIWYLDNADEGLNQSPLLAPSVFNFFSPNYRHPGALSAANLVAPEFQITTETSMVGGINFFSRLVRNGYYGSGETRLTLNLAELNAFASDPPALADRLNLLFMNGAMSESLRNTLVLTLGQMPKTGSSGGTTVTDRVKASLILMTLSPDFAIQK